MKAPKFNFVSERLLNEPAADTSFRVSIYKTGTLVFTGETLDIYDLENKYIRLFADRERRSIAWQVLDDKTSLEELNDARKVVKNTNGIATISIKKILKIMGITELGKGWKNLEVKTYKTTLQSGELYYVVIPQKEHEYLAPERQENGAAMGK